LDQVVFHPLDQVVISPRSLLVHVLLVHDARIALKFPPAFEFRVKKSSAAASDVILGRTIGKAMSLSGI